MNNKQDSEATGIDTPMYGTHKDERPLKTIAKIRNILNSIGIMPIEHRWDSFGESNFSLALSDPGLSVTNGKGISREFALAGAYGEFIERVQNSRLYKPNYGLMKEPLLKIPDTKEMDLIHAVPFLGKLAAMYALNPQDENQMETGIRIPFLPFYNVFDKEVSYIPASQIESSNGMCAGNTPEEAIVEGICEVIERYVLSRFFFESAYVPTIPLSYVKKLEVIKLIEDIRKKGFLVIVKDFSLGGKYPAVGTLLFNKDRTKYSVRIGSSPNFETALQRCLTEVAQNCSFTDVEFKMVDVEFEFSEELFRQRGEEDNLLLMAHYHHNLISGVGHYPVDIFSEAPEDGLFQDAFEDSFTGNAESLAFLLRRLEELNHKVYVRDASFLKFPSYQIYISELSCVDPLWLMSTPQEVLEFHDRGGTRSNLLRIESLNNAQLRELADCMALDIDECPSLALNVSPATEFLPGILLKNSNSHTYRIDNLPYALLLVLILYKLGEYKDALEYFQYVLDRETAEYEHYHGFNLTDVSLIFNKKLGRGLPKPDPSAHLHQTIYFFLSHLCRGLSHDDAAAVSETYFGTPLTQGALEFLSMKPILLPNCGDCSTCPVNTECHFDEWKERITAIGRRMEEYYPKQEDMAKVFDGLLRNR